MPAKTICVANRKGGVGKTTVTVLLAQAIKEIHGKSVAVIDVDPQASATRALAGEPSDAGSLHEKLEPILLENLLGRSRKFDSMNAAAVRWGQASALTRRPDVPLALVPCSPGLWDLEDKLANDFPRRQRVRRAWRSLLNRVRREFDIVLIDTPPGRSFFGQEALHTADMIIVPCDVTPVSISAMKVFGTYLQSLPKRRQKPAYRVWTKHKELKDAVDYGQNLDRTLTAADLKKVEDLMPPSENVDMVGLKHSPTIAKGIGKTDPGSFESVYGSKGLLFASALADAALKRLEEIKR